MMTTLISRQRLSRLALLTTLAATLILGCASLLGLHGARANGSTPEIEACINKYTGVVRMSAGNQPLNCTSSETKRTWSGQDRVGLSDIQIITADAQHDNQTNFSLPAYCPAGTQIIGGGAATSGNAYELTDSHPSALGNYWIAEVKTDGAASPVTLVVYAVCAQAGS